MGGTMRAGLVSWLVALAGAALMGLAASQGGRAVDGMGFEARDACLALKRASFPDTRLTLVEAVEPKGLWPYPKSIFTAILRPGDKGGVEAPFCRVAGVIEKEIAFEIWLPVHWNGKLMNVGNGGFSGALNYAGMGGAIARGYATASTDTGHTTPTDFFDDSWVAGHPQRVIDFGHRGHHLLAVTSKKIAAAFYNEAPKRAYFSGCSSGGWQGLTEAQKYPEDYDGIIAGAPANNFVRLQTRGFWNARLAADDPAGNIGDTEIDLLVKSAVARCDAKDGVTDGIIGDPERCDFDPKQLQCKRGAREGCLTPAQVRYARLLYGPAKTAAGLTLYPGNAYGAPPWWALLGATNALPANEPMIMKATRELAGEVPFTPASFDSDRDIPWLEARIGPVLSSIDPDLSAFAARGGKLILYHGWNDPGLSPYNTIGYYKSVQDKMGRKETERFARLFMAPGMEHCAGGPGPDRFDMVAALEAWVERGEAPERIIAERWREDLSVERSRPLCAYPKVAKYTGKGSTDDAANFVCK